MRINGKWCLFIGILLVGLIFLSGSTLAADELWVDDDAEDSWYDNSTHFQTIQVAINNTDAGDTINIAPGEYEEKIAYNENTNLGLLVHKNDITLQGVNSDGDPIESEDEVQATIISGAQSNWGTNFYITSENVKIKGLELRGTDYPDSWEPYTGYVNKAIEAVGNGFVLKNSIIRAKRGLDISSAVYINDDDTSWENSFNPEEFESDITSYQIFGNKLLGGVSVANGPGSGHDRSELNMSIQDNEFLQTPESEDYDDWNVRNYGISVTGLQETVNWRNAHTVIPTSLENNTFGPELSRIFASADDDSTYLPDLAYVKELLSNNDVPAASFLTKEGELQTVPGWKWDDEKGKYVKDKDNKRAYIYDTAQEAVEDAEKNSSVNLWSGEYEENLSLNKSISLVGVTNPLSSNLIASVSGARNSQPTIRISTDGTAIRNLNIANTGNEGEVEGIFVGDASGFSDSPDKNITIDNNIIGPILPKEGSGKTVEGIHMKSYDEVPSQGDSTQDPGNSVPINGVNITNNRIQNIEQPNAGANGIKIQADVNNVNVRSNTIKDISGLWSWGVVLTPSSLESGVPDNISIDRNVIKNVMLGLGVDGNSDLGYADASEIRAHFNSITNVALGAVNKDPDNLFDSSLNWWGSNDGPSHESNPNGEGVKVTDNVIFSPWLGDSIVEGTGIDTDSDTPGVQLPNGVNIVVDDVGPTNSGYLSKAIWGSNNLPGKDNVNVLPGDYYDAITITGPVKLQGSGADSTILKGRSTTNKPSTKILIDGVQGDVQIEGLTIDSMWQNGVYDWTTVVGVTGKDGAKWKLSNNVFRDGTVYFDNTDPDIIINNNEFEGFGYEAIGWENHLGTMEIAGNTMIFDPSEMPEYKCPGAIKASAWPNKHGEDWIVRNNVTAKQWIHDNVINLNGGIGIVFNSYTGSHLRNQFEDDFIPGATKYSDIVIEDNRISGVGDLGHSLYGNQGILLKRYGDEVGFENTVIRRNTISAKSDRNETAYGVNINGKATNSQITQNIIKNFDFGISIEDGAVTGGTTTVQYNSIYNNFSYGLLNETGGTVDATLNYWGHATGPYHPTKNSKGKGNKVSDNVIFSPWLIVNPDAEPDIPGVQLEPPMKFVVDDKGPAPAAGYLDKAIGATNQIPGSTIVVNHGTYSPDKQVTQGVEIVSVKGSPANSHIKGGELNIASSNVRIGKRAGYVSRGFTVNSDITVKGEDVNASRVHINWNNLFGMVTNDASGTLDARHNYWGEDGPEESTEGEVNYTPALPERVGEVLDYMEENGIDVPANAVAGMIAEDASSSEQATALLTTMGFDPGTAGNLLNEYDSSRVTNAMNNADTGGQFFELLSGYSLPAGGAGGLTNNVVAGGAGSVGGRTVGAVFTKGETVEVSFPLADFEGEPATNLTPTVSLVLLNEDGEKEGLEKITTASYEEDGAAYVTTFETTGLEPGYYEVQIDLPDRTSMSQVIQIEEKEA